MALFSY